MKHTAMIAGLVFALQTSPALTDYPENGWWWNQDASGRGYLLERQGDTIFLASFHYTAEGDPDWLVAVGEYTVADGDDDSEDSSKHASTPRADAR